MANPLDTAAMLIELKEKGSTIALDDFGTGYSSFSYLHRFPIDTLKIDKSFISTMLSNPKSFEIVKSLCILAQSIGMTIVAEGIESADEGSMLTEMGVHFGQGYFYAKPLPKLDFQRFPVTVDPLKCR
jgi:EAL domain-containing protein (putative c-di-GMP-specific phosphodiesterase class I)